VQVTNVRKVGIDIEWTANYEMQEHGIELPSNEIAGCETYQVKVNSTMYEVEASYPEVGTGPSAKGMVGVCPIVSVEVVALESFSVQYRMNIVSALLIVCAEFPDYVAIRP